MPNARTAPTLAQQASRLLHLVPKECKMMEPLRILVADDNEDAAEALGLILGIHGHEV